MFLMQYKIGKIIQRERLEAAERARLVAASRRRHQVVGNPLVRILVALFRWAGYTPAPEENPPTAAHPSPATQENPCGQAPTPEASMAA